MATRGVISFKVSKTGTRVDAVFDDTKTTLLQMQQSVMKVGAVISEMIYDFSDHPPGADAGPDQNAARGALVTLDGSRSVYPLMGIKRYEWTQVSGPPVTLSSRTVPKPTFTIPSAAANGSSLVFELKITTNNEKRFTDTTKVSIGSAGGYDGRPIADAGSNLSVDEGSKIVLDGSGSSDPDGGRLTYKWVQKSGVTMVALSDPASVRPTLDVPEVGPAGGSLTFRLTVTNENGGFSSDEITIRILWVPEAGYNKISAQEAKNMIDTRDDLIVVDVREQSEYCESGGHIPCAVNYPWDTGVLEAKYGNLPQEADILVVCDTGDRSAVAAEFLLSKGFTSVYDMGGLNVWQGETATCGQVCDKPPVGGKDEEFTPRGFVARFYRLILGRNPDEAGLAGWTAAIGRGAVTGADLAEGFLSSEEFNRRGTTDEAFLIILYRALMNREPNPEWIDEWAAELASGTPRGEVVEAFISSEEFANLARVYGVAPYTVDPVEAFVSHFYTAALNRTPDAPGLGGWVGALKNGRVSGADLAVSFFLSPEFLNRKLTDEAFLTALYRTLMNREPDPGGLAGWLSEMNRGRSRADVLDGFTGSPEFAGRCAQVGITAEDPPNSI
ncbi:DUF4214 domain-containing protein [Desulfococcus sp.]|uniref:DUF4214 domain-containing protein n=1 Tax=Desulfococcus sp. TaxID=2025834 RepID=UPI00359357D9